MKTEQLTLSLPPPQRELLEQLTLTGYFGRNAVETATLLLWQALNECAPERLKRIHEMRAEHDAQQIDRMKEQLQQIAAIVATNANTK